MSWVRSRVGAESRPVAAGDMLRVRADGTVVVATGIAGSQTAIVGRAVHAADPGGEVTMDDWRPAWPPGSDADQFYGPHVPLRIDGEAEADDAGLDAGPEEPPAPAWRRAIDLKGVS